MNYASIKTTDVANGPGVRVSLFVSGCTHRCEDCFNEEAWDFSYGKPFDEQARRQVMSALDHDYIEGLSVLGGEPFEPENQKALLPFLASVRERYPKKTVWCYSGYMWEELMKTPSPGHLPSRELIKLLDVLVDGRYEKDLRDLNLKFRGSKNQRILDVRRSLLAGEAVWCGEYQNG